MDWDWSGVDLRVWFLDERSLIIRRKQKKKLLASLNQSNRMKSNGMKCNHDTKLPNCSTAQQPNSIAMPTPYHATSGLDDVCAVHSSRLVFPRNMMKRKKK